MTAPLPRPYQLLAEIVAEYGDLHPLLCDTVQELAIELWRAGQTERRAIDLFEYDPPLWCHGMLLEEVTRAVGVPTVAPSVPGRDLGRGRTIREGSTLRRKGVR